MCWPQFKCKYGRKLCTRLVSDNWFKKLINNHWHNIQKNVLLFSFCVGWLYIMRSHTFEARRSWLAPLRKQCLFVSLAHAAFELPMYATQPYLLFKVPGGDIDLLLPVHSKTHPWINNESSTADRHLYKTDKWSPRRVWGALVLIYSRSAHSIRLRRFVAQVDLYTPLKN